MDSVPTGFLRSAPSGLSRAWKHVFDTFAEPINLVTGMRDKVVSESRNFIPQLTLGTMHYYDRDLSQARTRLIETLAILDAVTPRTWNAGHAILKAVGPVFTALGYLNALSNDKISFTAAERDTYIADTRRRIFNACTKFNERPLLEELRRSVIADRNVELVLNGPLQRRDKLWELSIPNVLAEVAEVAAENSSQKAIEKRPKKQRPKRRPKKAANKIGARDRDSESLKRTCYKKLGIEVWWTRKTVTKGAKEIQFQRSEVQWHIFTVALAAFPRAYSLEEMKNGYPGENNPHARKSSVTSLNHKLKRIGLRIADRRLHRSSVGK